MFWNWPKCHRYLKPGWKDSIETVVICLNEVGWVPADVGIVVINFWGTAMKILDKL